MGIGDAFKNMAPSTAGDLPPFAAGAALKGPPMPGQPIHPGPAPAQVSALHQTSLPAAAYASPTSFLHLLQRSSAASLAAQQAAGLPT